LIRNLAPKPYITALLTTPIDTARGPKLNSQASSYFFEVDKTEGNAGWWCWGWGWLQNLQGLGALFGCSQHLGLYILNGLSPSPRVEYKNWPQREDFVHGSDLMCHAFSGSAEWRHIQLRAFFIHNLAIYPPSQKHCPN
jgi:hypothetical protein